MSDAHDLTLRDWNRLIWAKFESIIHLGEPLYLTVDNYLLNEIIKDKLGIELDSANASQTFNNACNELLVNAGDYVSIPSTAWEKDEKGRSLAMCLAAQQILAVEQMYSGEISGEKFTSNAYFPRYRELIKVSKNVSSCPMYQYEFRRIWAELEGEILETEGATYRTVTFKQVKSPRDKNRAYPMSQAMLNRDDVNNIAERIQNISELTDQTLLSKIHHLKSYLSKRGVDIVFNDSISPQVISQIRNYLFFRDEEKNIKRRQNRPQSADVEFIIYWKEIGWDELFVLYHQDAQGIHNDSITHDKFDEYFAARKFVLFRQDGDKYVSVNNSILFSTGEDFLLAMKITAELDGILPDDLSFQQVDSTLSEKYLLFEIDGETILDSIEFMDDRLRQILSIDKTGLVLSGGIRLPNKNTYLLGYGPKRIEYNGSEIPESETLFVNKKSRSCGDLLQVMSSSAKDLELLIEYKDSKIIAYLRRQLERGDLLIGYLFYPGDKLIEPEPQVIEDEMVPFCSHLQTFNILKQHHQETFSNLNDKYIFTPDEEWIFLPRSKINRILSDFENIDRKSKALRNLKARIVASNRIPGELFVKLKSEGVI